MQDSWTLRPISFVKTGVYGTCQTPPSPGTRVANPCDRLTFPLMTALHYSSCIL